MAGTSKYDIFDGLHNAMQFLAYGSTYERILLERKEMKDEVDKTHQRCGEHYEHISKVLEQSGKTRYSAKFDALAAEEYMKAAEGTEGYEAYSAHMKAASLMLDAYARSPLGINYLGKAKKFSEKFLVEGDKFLKEALSKAFASNSEYPILHIKEFISTAKKSSIILNDSKFESIGKEYALLLEKLADLEAGKNEEKHRKYAFDLINESADICREIKDGKNLDRIGSKLGAYLKDYAKSLLGEFSESFKNGKAYTGDIFYIVDIYASAFSVYADLGSIGKGIEMLWAFTRFPEYEKGKHKFAEEAIVDLENKAAANLYAIGRIEEAKDILVDCSFALASIKESPNYQFLFKEFKRLSDKIG